MKIGKIISKQKNLGALTVCWSVCEISKVSELIISHHNEAVDYVLHRRVY